MFDLIIGIFGLVGGAILSLIAVEELVAGRRYFILMKRMLFLIISLLIFYFFREKIVFLIIFFLAAVLLFTIEFYGKSSWKELGNYAFVVLAYALSSNGNYHLLLSSFLFLYGLPTGTLLWQARKILKRR
ncbi:MAG TPA: hypothetical protein VJI15_02295 [Candidatus Nanoarchaeia archaeon]|nr:hypothetical protein [Candidatus Nanoarchaeia archaeon]